MVSGLDMAGLALGAVIAILGPILTLIPLRRRFHLELRYVALGIVGALASAEVWVYAFPAINAVASFFAEGAAPKGSSHSTSAIEFVRAFSGAATNVIVELTVGLCLLSLFAPRNQAGRPALAFGLGAFGWISWQMGGLNIRKLALATKVNDQDADAVLGFGYGANLPEGFITKIFGLGLPNAAAATASSILYVALVLVAWSGWRLRRWNWIAATYAIALGIAAFGALLQTIAKNRDVPLESLYSVSSVGVAQAYGSAIGLAVVIVLYFARTFFTALLSLDSRDYVRIDPPKSDLPEDGGLLGAWRAQKRRD